MDQTGLGDVDLSAVTGLETCRHDGPSIIDHRTLQRSGRLPLAFLRGVGLPDSLIEYLPSLLNQPIQMYSCFISYSSKDQDFADRLHADLQTKGVRCWFAPHDLPIGAKTWDAIDEEIKLRDKLLLILSENSIVSDWVEDEVNKAFAEERDRKQDVLFPVPIDDTVMATSEPWARKLRDQRNIGDFRKWRDHDAYQASLNRLLRGLTGRVEDGRGCLGHMASPRLPSPLIKLDVRVSRIQLSDRFHREAHDVALVARGACAASSNIFASRHSPFRQVRLFLLRHKRNRVAGGRGVD